MTAPALTNQTKSLQENVSTLVSLDIMHLLKRMDSVVLKCSGRTHTQNFDNEEFRPGTSIGYQLAGIPPVNRGIEMKYDLEFSQRTMWITCDTDRNYFSITNTLNQLDSVFYLNRKLITEQISAPALGAIRDKIEVEGIAWLSQYSAVVPSFGKTITQRLEPSSAMDWTVINWLNKLKKDLLLPSNYKLVLNTRDDMLLANELTHIQSGDTIVSKALTSGNPQKTISGLTNLSSPYMGLHLNGLSADQKDPARNYHLFFSEVPSSDQYIEGKLKYVNGGGASGTTDIYIDLKAGDIIYHIASAEGSTPAVNTKGLHWIQNTVKRSIPDSRYSFCITADAYIKRFKELIGTDQTTGTIKTSWKKFNYETVRYRIDDGTDLAKIVYTNNADEEKIDTVGIKLTFSHRPIENGYHQNCSRAILKDTSATPDRFLVYPNHYKNFLVHPEYFKFKSFKLPTLSGTEHAEVNDGNTGIKMLITRDRFLEKRQNIMDISSLLCFGCVGQNLMTLPTGEGLASIETVSLIGKKKK